MSITLCSACGHSFDLFQCRKVDFIFKNVSQREQMQAKALLILHIYTDADYKKIIFHACAYIVRPQVLICYVNT